VIPLAVLVLAAAVHLWPATGMASRRLSSLRRSGGPSQPSPGSLPLTGILAVSAGVVFAAAVPRALGILGGFIATTVVWLAVRRLRRRGRSARIEPWRLAASWDLLAACLRSGMPVPGAMRAIAAHLPPDTAAALGRVADLLALGADPVEAWRPAMERPETAALARGARRTTRSGAALAGVAAALANAVREKTYDAAEARAQRAAVLIAGPLGLCFLPAFLCLGIVPVVLGLAGRLDVLG
jgi:Flp pilus assembly protein TadB